MTPAVNQHFTNAFVVDFRRDVGGAVIVRVEAAEKNITGIRFWRRHVIARPHAAAPDAFELQRRIDVRLGEDRVEILGGSWPPM